MKLGEAVYRSQAGGPEGGDEGGPQGRPEAGEGVIDAEFEEVDDRKKSA